MTADDFRAIALSLRGATASSHNNHPDFRIGKRIFATLGYPDARYAMVKLTTDQQDMLVAAEPEMFSRAKGAWGKRGSTLVLLERLDATTGASAVRMAWENLAGR